MNAKQDAAIRLAAYEIIDMSMILFPYRLAKRVRTHFNVQCSEAEAKAFLDSHSRKQLEAEREQGE